MQSAIEIAPEAPPDARLRGRKTADRAAARPFAPNSFDSSLEWLPRGLKLSL